MKKIQSLTSQIFMIVSAIGFADALYLTQKHYTSGGIECPLFGGCEVVTTSQYATIFGVPLALLGLIYYSIIFMLSFWSFMTDKKQGMLLASQASLLGFLMSISLVYLMIYVIQAICFYCLVSALTSTLLFLVGLVFLKLEKSYLLKPMYDYIASFSRTELVWASLRIFMGFIFFWAFISRLPGWIEGQSPTAGFLENATSGVFADSFANMANSPLTDYFYMLGLGLAGLALILGISMKLATSGGTLMMFLFYLSSALPPEHNPIIDEHIIYICVLYLLYQNNSGKFIGFQNKWEKLKLVRQLPIFK